MNSQVLPGPSRDHPRSSTVHHPSTPWKKRNVPMTSTGLNAIADAHGRLIVLAMDQRATLQRMLTAAGQPAEPADLEQFKVDVIGALSPLVSGVLTDVDY